MKKILALNIASLIFINLHVFSGQLKEPKYISEKPEYVKLKLIDNKELTFVFDESKGTDTGYDILYADINFNNDLTDDAKITIERGNKFDLKFNIGDIVYQLPVYKHKLLTMDKTTNKMIPRISTAVYASAVMSNREDRWEYINNFPVEPNSACIEVFNKNVKLSVNALVVEGNAPRRLSVSIKFLGADEKETKILKVQKNKVQILPSLIIESEKGEIIVKSNFKPG